MYSLVLPGRLAVGACKYIVIVMLNISLDGCKAPESLFISQLWHALLSDERDGRLGTRGSVEGDVAPRYCERRRRPWKPAEELSTTALMTRVSHAIVLG